jgi:hypothetical protein
MTVIKPLRHLELALQQKAVSPGMMARDLLAIQERY